MKHFSVILIPIILICFFWSCVSNSDHKAIRSWAAEHRFEVVEIDLRTFRTGPYLITKDRRIYKVTTSDGIYWFRYGNLFSNDIEKETSSGYIKIQ